MAPEPPKHFLQFKDFSPEEFAHLFDRTRWIKAQFKTYKPYQPLADRTLAMIFEKQHPHPRVVRGGHAPARRHRDLPHTRDTQLGRGEPVEDAAPA